MLTILSTSAIAYYGYVTMYAPDGRTATVYAGDVAAWKSVGWFDSPVTVMYAPNGRTAYVGTNDVAAWKSVGWFDSPVTVMYAPDGRTAYVGTNDVAAWKSVGWFDSPVTVMYAPDGRTAYVGTNDVAAWKAVGWYTSPPPVDIFGSMSASEKRKLNIFLSNFSETFVNEYYHGMPYENYELISFAFTHNRINNPSKIFYTGSRMGISAADANATINKYFGRTVPLQTAYSQYGGINTFIYSNGNFTMGRADGESHSFFAIATSMVDNKNGTYTVEFNEYYDTYEGVASNRYSMSAYEAGRVCDLTGSGTAVVTKKIYNGVSTYQLEQINVY